MAQCDAIELCENKESECSFRSEWKQLAQRTDWGFAESQENTQTIFLPHWWLDRFQVQAQQWQVKIKFHQSTVQAFPNIVCGFHFFFFLIKKKTTDCTLLAICNLASVKSFRSFFWSFLAHCSAYTDAEGYHIPGAQLCTSYSFCWPRSIVSLLVLPYWMCTTSSNYPSSTNLWMVCFALSFRSLVKILNKEF